MCGTYFNKIITYKPKTISNVVKQYHDTFESNKSAFKRNTNYTLNFAIRVLISENLLDSEERKLVDSVLTQGLSFKETE